MSYDLARGAPKDYKPAATHDRDGKPVLSHPSLQKYTKRNHDKSSTTGANERHNPSGATRRFDKKTENLLQRHEYKTTSAAQQAAEAEILQTTEGGYLEAENEMEVRWAVFCVGVSFITIHCVNLCESM